MKLYQKMITVGLVVAGLAGLIGCKEDNSSPRVPQNNLPAYYSQHFQDLGRICGPYNLLSGDSDLTLADIDTDGDLDGVYTDRLANVYVVKNNLPQKNQK